VAKYCIVVFSFMIKIESFAFRVWPAAIYVHFDLIRFIYVYDYSCQVPK
jgi:hypothetical protein